MTGAFAHVREALTGVAHMLAGRSDFHSRFDVSSRGVAISFSAALIAIPFSGFAALVQNALAFATSGQLDGGVEPFSLTYVALRWLAIWAYFPLLAAAVTAILGRGKNFAPWVVVHNWTHLFVVMLQIVPMALIAAGAQGLGALLLMTSILVMVYAYVVAAKAALEVGWRLAIPCGCANLACMLLVDMGLREAL